MKLYWEDTDGQIRLYLGDARRLSAVSGENIQKPRDGRGRFLPGISYNPSGRFKKGHTRHKPKPYWNKEWLYNEYIIKQKAAWEIAADFGCAENNILYFLHKLNIPRRNLAEVHTIKYWGDKIKGAKNPMFGVRGANHHRWQGGITPGRQAFYHSAEWKRCVKRVWKRDEASCQHCGKQANGRGGADFHIHHIIPFEAIQLRAKEDNLLLLCKECHFFVHSEANVDNLYIRSAKGGGD